jgi:hypothetical protein
MSSNDASSANAAPDTVNAAAVQGPNPIAKAAVDGTSLPDGAPKLQFFMSIGHASAGSTNVCPLFLPLAAVRQSNSRTWPAS